MAVLPSSLALTNIPDGSNIVAATHRNNYAAIQTEANAVLAILGSGLAGQVLGGVGTTLGFVYPPGFELDYVEKTSDTSITATSASTATTIATGASVAFDGTAVWVEFFSSFVDRGNTYTRVTVWQDSTDLGIIGGTGTSNGIGGRRKLTPAAGTHTFTLKAYVDAGTGTVHGGAGGSGNYLPTYMRITKA